jgi:DNA-binding protein HU-beta
MAKSAKPETQSLRDLADNLAEHLEISKKAAYDALASLFGGINATVKKGGKVQIHGFGTFYQKAVKARVFANPQDRTKTVKTPAKKVVGFKRSRSVEKRK